MIKLKGTLSDDHVHMTAEEFCEHRVAERYEKHLSILRKLANNPILSEEVRDTVWSAIGCYKEKITWRSEYIRVCKENKELRKLLNGKYSKYHAEWSKKTEGSKKTEEESIADEIIKTCF